MGVSFDIYDENTVRRLIQEDPKLLPSISQKAIDRAKDTAWNRVQFTKDVTSAIMQGTPPSQLAKSLQHTMGLNQVSAIRNARTAITSAQNGGRMEGYTKLAAMGVEMQKEWIATLDNRTRDSHRDLDGERVAYNKTFSNGLMFPADPSGAGREVWNCRCTMRAIFPENNEPRKMTYYGQNAEKAYEKQKKEYDGFVKKKLGKMIDQPSAKEIKENKYLAQNYADMSKYKRSKSVGTIWEELKKVNPKYKTAIEYRRNCQRCIVAFEARMRGYDVTAKPREIGDALRSGSKEYGWPAVFKGATSNDCGMDTISDAYAKIYGTVMSYGEGARAVVALSREGKTGHVVIATRIGDEVHFLDPQTGEKMRESMWDTIIPQKVSVTRVDNVPFSELISKCVEDTSDDD